MLYVHSDAIERMAIFDGLEDSVVTHIISLMKQQIFLPYEYVLGAGQSGYGAIFIITGEVQLFKLQARRCRCLSTGQDPSSPSPARRRGWRRP